MFGYIRLKVYEYGLRFPNIGTWIEDNGKKNSNKK